MQLGSSEALQGNSISVSSATLQALHGPKLLLDAVLSTVDGRRYIHFYTFFYILYFSSVAVCVNGEV